MPLMDAVEHPIPKNITSQKRVRRLPPAQSIPPSLYSKRLVFNVSLIEIPSPILVIIKTKLLLTTLISVKLHSAICHLLRLTRQVSFRPIECPRNISSESSVNACHDAAKILPPRYLHHASLPDTLRPYPCYWY